MTNGSQIDVGDCAGGRQRVGAARRESIIKIGAGVRMGPDKSGGKSRQAQSLVRGGGSRVRRSIWLHRCRPAPFLSGRTVVLLGHSKSQRLLAVMYVDRGEAIRVISARRATRSEQRNYEENAR